MRLDPKEARYGAETIYLALRNKSLMLFADGREDESRTLTRELNTIQRVIAEMGFDEFARSVRSARKRGERVDEVPEV